MRLVPCSLPEMTKFFVILEAAIIKTSFVSMVLPFQFILFYLYSRIIHGSINSHKIRRSYHSTTPDTSLCRKIA